MPCMDVCQNVENCKLRSANNGFHQSEANRHSEIQVITFTPSMRLSSYGKPQTEFLIGTVLL